MALPSAGLLADFSHFLTDEAALSLHFLNDLFYENHSNRSFQGVPFGTPKLQVVKAAVRLQVLVPPILSLHLTIGNKMYSTH